MLYAEGELKIVEDASFVNRETGATVKYFHNYIQMAENKLLVATSNEDFSKYLDMEAVFHILPQETRGNENQFKLKLVSIVPSKE